MNELKGGIGWEGSCHMVDVLEKIVDTLIDVSTGQAYALCRRMTMLENYRLVSQSQTDLEVDVQQIDAKIEGTVDPLAKREYEESRRSLQERLSRLKAVSTQLDPVEAQLLSPTNEMDSIATEVIPLQAIGPGDASRHVPQLVTRMRDQSAQLRGFEREMIVR